MRGYLDEGCGKGRMTVTKSFGLLAFGKVYAKRRDILGVDLREEDVQSSETGLSYPKPRTLSPK